MGLSTEMAAELAWLKKLGDVASPRRATTVKVPAHEVQREPSFDLADLLESGLGPGPTSSYVEPPTSEQRLVIQRGPNFQSHQGFLLTATGGEPLLLARGNKNGTEFQIFPGHKWEASDDLQPMFSLQSNKEKTRWSLHSLKCERCQAHNRADCGQRLLARITQYSEHMEDSTALCMDVQVPDIREDGSLEVLCTACGDSMSNGNSRQFTTSRPVWHSKKKCMVLDFNGRVTLASSKNFKLETIDEDPSQVKLLFGKVGEQQFVLDHQGPFGTVQAFAAALSASHWK